MQEIDVRMMNDSELRSIVKDEHVMEYYRRKALAELRIRQVDTIHIAIDSYRCNHKCSRRNNCRGTQYTGVIQIGIYRDAGDGPCGVCMQKENWKDRLIDQVAVYSAKCQVRLPYS